MAQEKQGASTIRIGGVSCAEVLEIAASAAGFSVDLYALSSCEELHPDARRPCLRLHGLGLPCEGLR